MLPFDNNMMLMIAVALVIAAVAYMYRDLEKTKSELRSLVRAVPSQAPAPSAQKRETVAAPASAPSAKTQIDSAEDQAEE